MLDTSSYCAIRGHGENDRPLLDRIGSTLIKSSEALAQQILASDLGGADQRTCIYLPVILTTARLHVLRLDPAQISLATGELPDVATEEVEAVHYVKAFGYAPQDGADIRQVNELSQRALFVVNADASWNFFEALALYRR